MTGRIFLKLTLGVLCLLALALVTVDYFATQVVNDTYISNLTQQLIDKVHMLALSSPEPERFDEKAAHAMAQAAGGRITLVRSDGKVLVDSEANAAEMENHRTRPELIEAFGGKVAFLFGNPLLQPEVRFHDEFSHRRLLESRKPALSRHASTAAPRGGPRFLRGLPKKTGRNRRPNALPPFSAPAPNPARITQHG